MKKEFILFLTVFLFASNSFATLTTNNIPMQQSGGTSPISVNSQVWQVNNNIGIGSTNPGDALDVVGTVRSTGLIFTGNLGINSTSPGQSLDVLGTTRTTDFISGGPIADVRDFISTYGGGPGATTDSEPAIAACFATGVSTCYLSPGVWKTGETISIPAAGNYGLIGKKLLLDQQAIIHPTGNFNVVSLGDKARVSGGEIDASAVGSFTAALIYATGATNVSNGAGVDNMFLYMTGGAGAGDAILLQANQNNGSVSFLNFHDLTIINPNIGLHLQASNTYTGNYVNGNIFHDIIIVEPTSYGVYVDGDNTNGGTPNQSNGNTFTNIQVEAVSGMIDIVYCNGWYNFFTNIMPWDIENPQLAFNFTSTSKYNTMLTNSNYLIKGGAGYTNFLDSGTNNSITGSYNQVFKGSTLLDADFNGGYALAYKVTNSLSSANQNFGTFGTFGSKSSGVAYTYMAVPSVSAGDDPSGYNSANILTLTNTGNVGVGTTTPLNSLDVINNEAMGKYAGLLTAPTGGLIVSGNVGLGTSAPIGQLDVEGTVNPVIFESISGAKNVGIGSTNPGQKLDVIGTIRASLGISSGTNILYYCNAGVSAGNICRGNGCTCAGGTETAINISTN